MTKYELIQIVATQNPKFTKKQIEQSVETFFESISQALAKGNRVELRGFGVFEVRTRKARVGRNPKTGAAVKVPQKKVPFFKTSKILYQKLNA